MSGDVYRESIAVCKALDLKQERASNYEISVHHPEAYYTGRLLNFPDVKEELEYWMNILKTESNLLKEDQLKISNAFLSADNNISNLLETSQQHQQNDVMYPSKLINTSKILKAINVEAYEITDADLSIVQEF
ncbi:26753_t:CDS:2 [Dentiscutata erythropus]|uniref:26753_t:CDS:1 n=1 Tax=Dentiscutata erythropus TaxID=1348616 RepID=A0A9N9BE82_9GLOM|nr:26753_t:CDS:2 [Dentiscutata erythropus]